MQVWHVMFFFPVLFGLVIDIIGIIQAKKYKNKIPSGNEGLIVVLSIFVAIEIIAIIFTMNCRGGDPYGWFLLVLVPIDFGISLIIFVIAIILTILIIKFAVKNKINKSKK